ncbi:MAG: M20/M25/M40 family metallo-hydrolase [Bacteroidetes bacterium]|nr:M20/M25/M40 family metallo-hydrolase [Bacteroidota bacterium]
MKKTRTMIRVWLALLSMVILIPAVSAGNGPRPDETEFPIDELKGQIYFLASDYLGGRVTDEPGYTLAAEYVKTQFMAAGLKPFIASDNPDDQYFHQFNLNRNDYHCDAPMILKTKSGDKTFELDKDFKLIRTITGGMVEADLETVFVGYGIEEPDADWNDYEDLEVSGKNAVILFGAPFNNGEPILNTELHEKYNSKPGLSIKLRHLMEKKPAAIMLVINDDLQDYYDRRESQTQVFSNEYNGSDYRMAMLDNFYRLYLIKPYVADALFGSTPNRIEDIEKGNLERYAPGLIPGLSVNLPVRVEEKEVLARNVVGMIEGTDSILKNEYLLIGGHLDHEPNFNGIVNNGADDNASGVTTVIELARYFVKHPLKRTILFAAWSAEEGGCYGSRNFVETFPGGHEQIVAAMNFDCVGRNGKNAEERFQTYMLDAVKVCPEMLPLVDRINAETVNFRIEKEMSPRWGTSDQESFINVGIPVVDFFNGGTVDLHRPTDDPEKIDYEYLQKMCILGAAIAEELGNMEKKMCADDASL